MKITYYVVKYCFCTFVNRCTHIAKTIQFIHIYIHTYILYTICINAMWVNQNTDWGSVGPILKIRLKSIDMYVKKQSTRIKKVFVRHLQWFYNNFLAVRYIHF